MKKLSVTLGSLVAPTAVAIALIECNSCATAQDLPTATLEQLRSEAYLESLLERIDSKIAPLEDELKHTSDDGDRDDLEDEIEICELAEENLKRAQKDGSNAAITRANSDAFRILNALEPIDESVNELPPANKLFRNVVWGSLFGHGIPIVSPQAQQQPLGAEMATAESWYLYNEKNDSFFLPEELARFTPEQISQIDIDPDHPAWYRREIIDSARSNRIRGFQGEIAKGMTQNLHQKDDLEKKHSYDLYASRKVLILEEVYLSATSPKATTEDVHGVEWKLKWGDEVSVEPVASRLYLLAGAKMTDLTFANAPGKYGTTLVLNKEGASEKDEKDDDERHAETVEQLIAVLDEMYGFDVTPYILNYGTITKGNADDVLADLPKDDEAEYKKKDLIGRQWVTFRECGVELKPKGYIRRNDGAPLFDSVALHDRVGRGIYLFDLWIGNRDVKYDNRKMYFRKSYEDGDWELADYFEGHHDLGLALGGFVTSGSVNKFSNGDKFAKKGNQKLRFRVPLLFKPDAWKSTTWSDAKWMARHIASITEPQIREAVSYSLWPDFVQETLTYRLLDRRNKMAELFGLTDLLDKTEVTAPSLTVPLRNAEEIAAAERHYGLPPGSLSEELKKRKIGSGYSENVLTDGTVATMEKSALVYALVKYRHPSGLNKRYKRSMDQNPI